MRREEVSRHPPEVGPSLHCAHLQSTHGRKGCSHVTITGTLEPWLEMRFVSCLLPPTVSTLVYRLDHDEQAKGVRYDFCLSRLTP